MSEKLNQTATSQCTYITMVDAKKIIVHSHAHVTYIHIHTIFDSYVHTHIHEKTSKIYILNAQKRETVEQATIYVSHSSKNKLIRE